MIQIVAAIANNNVIGNGNAIPWRLPADLRHFKKLTMGHTLLMGRKTFESIGKVLPGRTTIVISRGGFVAPQGVLVADSFDAALAKVPAGQEAFVVGGAEIYELALSRADKMHLTRIVAHFPGDTMFPDWDPTEWKLDNSEEHPADAEAPFEWELQEWSRRG